MTWRHGRSYTYVRTRSAAAFRLLSAAMLFIGAGLLICILGVQSRLCKPSAQGQATSIQSSTGAWGDGSEVKRACCSLRGPEVSSQHLQEATHKAYIYSSRALTRSDGSVNTDPHPHRVHVYVAARGNLRCFSSGAIHFVS